MSHSRLFHVFFLSCLVASATATPLAPTQLRCEGRGHPVGIDAAAPHFSWWLQDNTLGAVQGACRIEVQCDGRLKWDSGQVEQADSVDVAYAGPPLVSGESRT